MQHPFCKSVIAAYNKVADAEKAIAMKAYMKGHFDFYGIPKPIRKIVNTALFKEFDLLEEVEKIAIVKTLWKAPQRELHYFAVEAIARKPKLWPVDIHLLFDEMILHKSWWDTVDTMAVWCCGVFLQQHPEFTKQKIKTWTDSDSFWMHRTALLFQLKYKGATDVKLLFRLCEKYASQKEFFIRKAIGWVLREYSKTNPDSVADFIDQTALSPLSIKEGSKYL